MGTNVDAKMAEENNVQRFSKKQANFGLVSQKLAI